MKDRLLSLLKFKTTITLLVLGGLSLILLFTRMAIADSIRFRFLLWNLFLAFIPWLVAGILYVGKNMKQAFLFIFIFLWLVFFPNAPYILTDLIHLDSDPRVPALLDFLLLSCFGLTGLLFGYASLLIVEKVLSEKIRPSRAGAMSIFFIYLSALGIYLGRYLRWNSWDIFTNPGAVIREAFHVLMISGSRKNIWFFVIGFGTMLSLFYLLFRIAGRKDFSELPGKNRKIKAS